MRPIPNKLRAELAQDPEYRPGYCIFHDRVHPNGTKIEWHHNLIFAGRQVQARFCILPICVEIHDKANWKQVRERLDWIMLNRADNDELIGYSRAINLIRRKEQLNKKHGVWTSQKKN